MTADISRQSLRPAQKFTGVVRQQGRLPLDSDENEASDIARFALRDAVAEVICEAGSPDDGYRISAPVVTNGALDFAIAAGSFYLAGLRCATEAETYQAQPDWLTFPLDSPGPSIPTGTTTRTDLVWLDAWEQVVTATEDAELFERALGGADTTARQRAMARVRVLEDVPGTCAAAFDDLVTREFPGATLDAARAEILSGATMTVGFTQLDPLDDLCRPSAQAGFLGARNEAFRVQVTTPGRFVWGRDNAAPLYRVQVAVNADDGLRRRIVFLTLPRDEFGWPLAGMTVELLRWGAHLANGEKAAEPTGLLLRVENGFDPASASILVASEPPLAWEQWFTTPEGQAAINPRDPQGAGTFFFLRVWTGGGAGGAVDQPMNTGSAVALGDTGLTVTFAGTALAGDYWIIAARPNTPTLVTPWALLDGAPPAGPRRLAAPLALLPWTGATPGAPIECRHHFRPLCRVGTCCIVTVGDGRLSHGDVTSIQEAVDRLPTEGGEICLHPGIYTEHVTIADRRAITITGCGRNTVWRGEAGRADPLLRIVNSSAVIVRRLAMESGSAICIRAEDLPAQRPQGGPAMEHLLLEDLRLSITDAGAIAGLGGLGTTVRRCRIALGTMSATLSDDPVIGRAAAIFLQGDELLVEQCRIEAPRRADRLRLAVGGIHIGGDSRFVVIRDNVILGGNGHGITLGSVQYLPEPGGNPPTSAGGGTLRLPQGSQTYTTGAGLHYYGTSIFVDQAGCIHWPGTPPDGGDGDDGTPLVPQSGGLVRDVEILRNDIGLMGYSGISAHVFAGLGTAALGDAVAVEAIEIAGNRIEGCMRNEIGDIPALLRPFIGWGGIALSICADATIRDNLIAGNGASRRDPVCGVFLAVAEDVRIERNRIERNGSDGITGQTLPPGRRGGIIIGAAVGGFSPYGSVEKLRAVDRPALLVAGNTVDAPGARALKAILLGPCMVLGNRLTGAGRSAFAANVFASLVAAGVALSRLGNQVFDAREDIDLLDWVALELLGDVLGGDAVNLVSVTVAEDLLFDLTGTTYVPQRLRGGEMLVNDNQISLRAHAPDQAVTVSSVLLLGADDISFCDNQAEVENEVRFMLTNLLAYAGTLRASGNRLQERLGAGLISAATRAVMNQTANNQTTHCIIAIGAPPARVVPGNRSVLGLAFPAVCAAIDRIGVALSEQLGKQLGVGTATTNGGT